MRPTAYDDKRHSYQAAYLFQFLANVKNSTRIHDKFMKALHDTALSRTAAYNRKERFAGALTSVFDEESSEKLSTAADHFVKSSEEYCTIVAKLLKFVLLYVCSIYDL